MLVDDSAIVRGFMRRWIDEEPRIELAKACSDGAQAVAEAATIRPDVIVLDIEMPHLDGLSALPQLRKAAPDARIIMASTLTAAGATQTVKALALGASDFIAKPQAGAFGSVDTYRRELIERSSPSANGQGRALSHLRRPLRSSCARVHWSRPNPQPC